MRLLLALILTMVPALAQQADPQSKTVDRTAQASAQEPATPAASPASSSPVAATAGDQQATPAASPAPSSPAPATAAEQPTTPAPSTSASAKTGDRQATPPATPTPSTSAPANTGDQQAAPAAAPAPSTAAPSKTGDQTATPAASPAAAKTGDQQAAPAAAPAPSTAAPSKTGDPTATPAASPAAASPAPSGEQWFAGSVDLGYRWVTGPYGNYPEYRSVVNLGQGLVLNGVDFTIIDPKKRLFDKLDASAYGWGGEPYEAAHLDARKQGVYDFLFDYRNIAFFDAVPSYANPVAPGGFNEQSFDTRRTTMTVGLDLRPGKRIIPYLVYERNSGYGNGVEEWVQDSNDEFAVPTLLRDSTDNYRGGVRFEFKRFHITIEQGGTTFKDDDQADFSGTNLGDRTSSIFGQTLSLTSLQQSYGITGKSLYSKALMTARPFSWLDIYGQFLYSDPKTTVNFNETAGGNFLSMSELLFYSSQQTIGTGAANQPHTTGTLGFELRPLKHLRVTQNWMTDRYHDAAFGMLSIAPTTSTGGGISSLNPLQIVNYNQEEVDAYYDVTSKLTVRGGYRYVWGDATTDATPFLNPAGTLEQGQLKRNIWMGGINFRASEKLSFNLDYEGGDSDDIYFRDSLNNYHKGRARAKYRVLPSLMLQATANLLKNTNPAPTIQYNLLSRDTSLAVFWTPKNSKLFSLTGQYDRGTMHSTIDYLTLPFYTGAVSDYRDNGHSVTGLLDVNLPGPARGKLSMGGSMFLSNGSNTTRYYQPLARLSFPIGKHVAWNTEWKYYGYQENFYLFESFRTHIFMTGLKLTR